MTARDVAAALPDIETLRTRCRAVAMLDAILSPDVWDNRFYSYTANWGDGQAATEIRNGSGDDCFIVFASGGAFIKGVDHESEMAPGRGRPAQLWPGLVGDVPKAFAEFLDEPAFSFDDVLNATFCIWRENHDSRWRTGAVDYTALDDREDPDGSHAMLGMLIDPDPQQAYRDFASTYFEVVADAEAVAHVFDLRPLTPEVVRRLNAHTTLEDLASDIAQSGYPTAQQSVSLLT
ncbi:hypothetical protein QN239_02805 [Mycolicibacterium sp. Y3]